MNATPLDADAFVRHARTVRTQCGATPAACPGCYLVLQVDIDCETLRCPTCRREWRLDEMQPCAAPASVPVVDDEGDSDRFCLAHAALFARIRESLQGD